MWRERKVFFSPCFFRVVALCTAWDEIRPTRIIRKFVGVLGMKRLWNKLIQSCAYWRGMIQFISSATLRLIRTPKTIQFTCKRCISACFRYCWRNMAHSEIKAYVDQKCATHHFSCNRRLPSQSIRTLIYVNIDWRTCASWPLIGVLWSFLYMNRFYHCCKNYM